MSNVPPTIQTPTIEVKTSDGSVETIPVDESKNEIININLQSQQPQETLAASDVKGKVSPGFFKGEHKHTHWLIVIGVLFELVFGLGVWYFFDAVPQHQLAKKTEATQKTLQTQVTKLNDSVDTTAKSVSDYQKQINVQMTRFNSDMGKTLKALGFHQESSGGN